LSAKPTPEEARAAALRERAQAAVEPLRRGRPLMLSYVVAPSEQMLRRTHRAAHAGVVAEPAP
jgi:hypothetical protein